MDAALWDAVDADPAASDRSAAKAPCHVGGWAAVRPFAVHATLTNAFRRAVKALVKEAGLPSFGQGWPFIRTKNWRKANGTRKSKTLRFLLRA